MKKLLKNIICLCSCLILSGCEKNCTFEEFNQAAKNIKEHNFTTAHYKRTFYNCQTSEGVVKYSSTYKLFSGPSLTVVDLINNFKLSDYVDKRYETTTYNIENGFSVYYKLEKDGVLWNLFNYKWNEYGLITRYEYYTDISSRYKLVTTITITYE